MKKYTKTHKADLSSDWLLCPLHPKSFGVGERERERETDKEARFAKTGPQSVAQRNPARG